jgi:hypothetical protein
MVNMAKITPIKAIRKKCLECSGGSSKEVKCCPITNCPLYLYRFGRRPTEQEKKEIGQTLKGKK